MGKTGLSQFIPFLDRKKQVLDGKNPTLVIYLIHFPGGNAGNYIMVDCVFQFADKVSYHLSSCDSVKR